MAFEPKKFNELYDAMRSRTSVLTDFEVGSVARTMYESFASELGLLYQKMNLVYLSAFVDSAQGMHLDQVVAILGILRSLPDFAVGEVVFLRDKGNADINISAGTLVATEDTPGLPKKVYQTIDSVVLAKDQSEVTVKVQAINRGEDQDCDHESILVMPRPIPGIKSVNNPQPGILVGRRRETDDELRRRAKNALLSSGKANLAALENAVLGLPGVLDVKVREEFHQAKGIITITRAAIINAATLPKASTISAGAVPPLLPFRLARDVDFKPGESAKLVQIVSLLEGRQGELETGSSLKFDDSALAATYTISYTNKIEQSQFGMAEVIVDTPDFSKIKEQVVAAVDAVRAAGVFVSVTGAQKVSVDGVFRIAAAAQLNLSIDERVNFEEKVRQEIIAFFQSVKMGQPVLFSKMMKAVLSVEGVDDLSEFRISTLVKGVTGDISRSYFLKDNKIEADELERFYPKYLCVASEDKLLPVNVTFKAEALDVDKTKAVKTALESYLNGVAVGGEILRTEIQTRINSAVGAVAGDLKVRPVSWYPNPEITPNDTLPSYIPKFVEKPILGNLFGYKQEIRIGGAILLLLPNNVNEFDKGTIRTKARENIVAYLDALAPEDDVIIDTLLSEVKKDKRVLETKFSEDDLVITILSAPAVTDPNRFKDGKIDVKAFEKATLGSTEFVIATEVTNVEITVNAIKIVTSPASPGMAAAIKAQVAHTVESFLVGYVPGQDMAYNDLKSALLNLSFGVSFTLTELSINAVSIAGFSPQSASAAAPQDIVVREIEMAIMKTLPIINITVS
jgi:uncharacterized phage protein gp47/JayE